MKSLFQTIQHNLRMSVTGVVVFLAFFLLSSEKASAQSYQTPAQALATIDATLSAPNAPSKGGNGGSATTQSAQAGQLAMEAVVKRGYLLAVKDNLQQGQQTGAAIEAVYQSLVSNSGGGRLPMLDAARTYAINLLDQ